MNSSKQVPTSVSEKINKLKEIETLLGHLPPENWNLGELFTKITDDSYGLKSSQLENETEIIFLEICRELTNLGFNSTEIAVEINNVLRYEGGPKYCNSAEVSEILNQE